MSKRVVIGDFTFEDDDIISVVIETAADVVGDELQSDVAEITVRHVDGLDNIEWETPVDIYSDGIFVGKFYFTSAKRINKLSSVINATSLVGLMEYETYYGDYYNGTLLSEIIPDLIKSDGLNRMVGLNGLEVDSTSESRAQGVTFSTGMVYGGGGIGESSGFVSIKSRLHVRFKYYGFSSNYAQLTSTYYTATLCGFYSTNTAVSESLHYGVYGVYRRDSTSEPYPQTTELFFKYTTQIISIGTPAVGDIIEIDCSPSEGKVTINGVEHELIVPETDYNTPIMVVGGGLGITAWGTTGAYWFNPVLHNNHLIFYDYSIYNQSGTVLFNLQASYNCKTGSVYAQDTVSGRFRIVNRGIKNNVTEVTVPGLIKQNYRDGIIQNIIYGDGVASLHIYGLLPKLKKREALHQLLFATGVTLKKTEDGALLFDAADNNPVSTISEDAIYMEGATNYLEKVNNISISEYSYIDNTSTTITDRKVIYENETNIDKRYVAEFESPSSMWVDSETSYSLSGTEIIEHCANAALVFGGESTIYGFPYTIQKRTISRSINNAVAGKNVFVDNLQLVTLQNADSILDRLESYYGSTYQCTVNFVRSLERCGWKYIFTDAFSNQTSGFAIKMKTVLSAVDKSSCEFLVGYIAGKIGEGYNNYVVLSGSGTWEVPQSVFEKENPRIRVIMIGGGEGGSSGYAGETGKVISSVSATAQRAEGGNVGLSGSGGNIYSYTIDNPSSSLTYLCGEGGVGGAISQSHENSNAGLDGADTSVTCGNLALSSQMGEPNDLGVVNFFNGERYAIPFPVTVQWDEYLLSSEYDGNPLQVRYGGGGYGGTYTEGPSQSSVRVYAACSCVVQDPLVPGGLVCLAGEYSYAGNIAGGAGGGGGCGSSGGNGSAGSINRSGNGGNGGDATWTPPKATDYNEKFYGCGGLGGGGGGGGGSTGPYSGTGSFGTPGSGGYGGAGGDGGNGCVIVYY